MNTSRVFPTQINRPPLTPVVSIQGEVAAYNIINGNSRSIDYSIVPNVVFTIRPINYFYDIVRCRQHKKRNNKGIY